MKKFIPFKKIKDKRTIVVDGLHPHATILSHWKGGNIHPEIEADTSGEIVLNALKSSFKKLNAPYVSANHFDIDGFVGVFALIYPELAKEYDQVLRQMAIIGDFREFDPKQQDAEYALKLCCWVNQMELKNFYRPFGEKEEMDLCDSKFKYFLKLFPKVLNNINDFKSDWEQEYKIIMEGMKQLENNSKTEEFKDISLFVRKTTKPIHYYSLFSKTKGFDIVLSVYDNNKYELEYKYTTWVDIASRGTLPRLDLKELTNQLNHLEQTAFRWHVDHIADTGPILRLENETISKADRYDHPYNRTIHSSSIGETHFKNMVIDFFKKHYQSIDSKRFWTWAEIKAINKNVKGSKAFG